MVELGELAKRIESFRERKVSVICIAAEGLDSVAEVKRRFPSLTVIADVSGELSRSAELLLRGGAPGGGDALAPTTILVDGSGIVRWIYRPKRIVQRLTPDELLAKIDELL